MKCWRFIGFDDGFTSFLSKKAHLVGCITSGNKVEGFLYSKIETDGFDSTEKLCKIINNSRFKIQIKCIFLYGISFAGMNVVDMEILHKNTGIPVISIMKKKPNIEKMKIAAKKAGNAEYRIKIIEKAGELHKMNDIYFQYAGCNLEDALKFIKTSVYTGKIPECLRIAHLVASALAYGESKKSD